MILSADTFPVCTRPRSQGSVSIVCCDLSRPSGLDLLPTFDGGERLLYCQPEASEIPVIDDAVLIRRTEERAIVLGARVAETLCELRK